MYEKEKAKGFGSLGTESRQYKAKVPIAGVTLVELIIVVILIGILAGLGMPNFQRFWEHTIGKEAIANLKLIAAAEKIYRMESGGYYGGADINGVLKLAIPSGGNWDYSVSGNGGFTAIADRVSGSCQYSITESQVEPAKGAECP